MLNKDKKKANVCPRLFLPTFEEDKFAIWSLVGCVDARREAFPELIDLHGITLLHLVVPQTPKPPILQHNRRNVEHHWRELHYIYSNVSKHNSRPGAQRSEKMITLNETRGLEGKMSCDFWNITKRHNCVWFINKSQATKVETDWLNL